MSFMFELYYAAPEDTERETQLAEEVAAKGGQLTYREAATIGNSICLTFEFESRVQAEIVASLLLQRGEHVEGVCYYDP